MGKEINSLKEYYAHISEDGMRRQTVADHLLGTAEVCREFASAFGAECKGEFIGLSHDIGKCNDGFQKRLLCGGPMVDHSTAGALNCAAQNPFIAMCISGHHSGLPDFGNPKTDRPGDATFCGRIRKGIEQKYLEACGKSGVELPNTVPAKISTANNMELSFWIRMLYSCLVDADFLDTEHFMDADRQRGGYDTISTLLDRLETYVKKWEKPKSDLDRLRCEILNTCLQAGDRPKGIYTLTVPTGGGKTISSMAFALKHAVRHGMKRVVYVIPYTSIIEQNAEVFRGIFGKKNVLEHHSNVQFDISDRMSPNDIRLALATENWDIPIVVTTAVQFFESIYANRPSKCRKLHNLADSVIIFDEAQTIPLEQLRPCTAAIASLAERFRSTVVLCTATQPILDDLLHTYAPKHPVTELCPQTFGMYGSFRRVTFRREGVLDDDMLAERLSSHKQVLCIVNSRKAARNIFSKMSGKDCFYLSTLMIPAQRQKILNEIRYRLEHGLPCRVISTSLIEAGVDIDFPFVYRELAGLDSVLQAAGRCNREGGGPASESIVFVFERTELPPLLFRIAIGAAREALSDGSDPDDPDAMRHYFRILREFSGSNDKYGIIPAFETGIDGCALPFRMVADEFHFIDKNTRTVYVPYGEEGIELIRKLRFELPSKSLYRALGRYSVSVFEEHFKALYDSGALLTAKDISTLDPNSAVLCNMELYSEMLGLELEPEIGKALFV